MPQSAKDPMKIAFQVLQVSDRIGPPDSVMRLIPLVKLRFRCFAELATAP